MKIGEAIAQGSYRTNYLNDPATKLVASHCAVCQKSLKDAVSVERGIGPDCYGKYYVVPGGCTAEQRDQANAIVRFIAVKAKGDEAILACKALEDLGFIALSGRIARRLAQIRIERHTITAAEYAVTVGVPATPCVFRNAAPDHFHAFTPYASSFHSAVKALPGAKFLKLGKGKCWAVSVEHKPALWAALQVFKGSVGVNAEGRMFVIGGSEAAKPVSETVPGLPGFIPTAQPSAEEIEKFLEQG